MPEYKTPGVYIEEISAGPRPVAAAATTDTGFVAILTFPKSFLSGKGKAEGMFLPGTEPQTLLAWNRALAFRPLLTAAPDAEPKIDPKTKKPVPAKKPSGNKLQALVDDVLEGKWTIRAPAGDGKITLKSETGSVLRIPAQASLVSVMETEKDKEWDLAWGADEQAMVQLLAGNAVNLDITH
ncbi:MAG: hypothetical protein HN348_21695, partial [Proteobacteria bacterium]|nr:hypothetical protein [Pseudomonadota bacterium]